MSKATIELNQSCTVPEGNKKVGRILYISIVFFYSICTIYLSCSAFAVLKGPVGVLDEISENWNQSPIIDIKVTTAQTCPTNYEDSLIKWSFPKLVEGCNCRVVTAETISQEVTRGSCTTNQVEAQCSEITPTRGYTMTFWGQTISSSKICIRRAANYSFMNAQSKIKGTSCSTGYKSCINTKDPCNIFCVKDPDHCPITGLSFQNELCDRSDPTCQQITKGFTEDKNIIFVTNNDGRPIVEFAMNEYGMCNSKTRQNIAPGRHEYILRENLRTSCGREGDKYWNLGVVDTLRESDFYKQNGLLGKAKESPDIKSYFDDASESDALNPEYRLYARTYIKWDTKCTSDFKGFSQTNKRLQVLRGIQTAVVIIFIISGFLFGIVLPILDLTDLFTCISSLKVLQIRLKATKSGQNNIKISGYVLRVMSFPIILTALVWASQNRNLLQDITQRQCLDHEWNSLVLDVAAQLHKIYTRDAALLALLCLFLLFDVILEIRKKWMNIKKTKSLMKVVALSSPNESPCGSPTSASSPEHHSILAKQFMLNISSPIRGHRVISLMITPTLPVLPSPQRAQCTV